MFNYIVEDNFFDDHELSEIKLYFKNNDMINKLDSNKDIILHFDNDFKKKIKKKYESKMLEFLKKLYPKKVDFYNYMDFNYAVSGKNFSYPVHNDAISKLLSVVIYISPEKNHGTFLYNSNNKDDLLTEIEWKTNRALIFSRKDKGTWHSYKSNNIENRHTVVMNLYTKNLDMVIITDRGWLYFYIYKILKILKIK
jgi:hypothetical protein